MMRAHRSFPNMHQGPTDAEDGRPHLSQPGGNCIVGFSLSFSLSLTLSPRLGSLHLRSAAVQLRSGTMLALMKPSDEVAITDFCHCHQGQWLVGWLVVVEG